MLESLNNDNHARVIAEHLAAVAPQLQRLDAAIAAAAAAGDPREAELRRAMRVYLASGLFDPEYYLRTYPDVRDSGADPLEHFVKHGEAEGRRPNPVLWPGFSWEDVFILSVPRPREFEDWGRPDQFALMQVKLAFRQLLGREEAFACYRRVVELPEHARIVPKRIVGLRAAAAEAGGAYYEISPGGERFRVALPRILGEGEPREVETTARAAFVACLIDAHVRGRSAAIEVGDSVYFDSEENERSLVADRLDFDPAIFEADDGRAWVIADDATEMPEIGEALSLVGPHTDGLAYWLWEYLPKYVATIAASALPHVPVLIDRDMPKPHREALATLLSPGVEMIEQPAFAPVRVRRLWCAPSPGYVPVLAERRRRFRWERLAVPPGRGAAIFAEMAHRLHGAERDADAAEKLFLGRRDFRHRRLHNARSVEAAASERGFQVVYAEELDLAGQLRAVRTARIILAPEGPAMFLALFARPGTRLLILSDPDTDALLPLTALLAELGVNVVLVTGPFVNFPAEIELLNEQRDGSLYAIDDERLATRLEEPEGASSARPPPGLPLISIRKQAAPTIGAFISTKDDSELIARNIAHHRKIGVGPIVVCDVGSTDGTLDVLRRYRQPKNFGIINIVEPDTFERHVPEALDMLARWGADWVVFTSADEFYLPASGRIHDCPALQYCDLLLVDRYNVPVGRAGPCVPKHLMPGRYSELLLITEPVANFREFLTAHPDRPWIFGVDAPTPMARPAIIGGVTDGLHDILTIRGETLRWSRPNDIVIAHLPLTTRSRFFRKVENIRRFVAAHAGEESSSSSSYWHWRRWLAMADEGRLEEEFGRSVLDAQAIAELRQRGVIRSAAELFGGSAEQYARPIGKAKRA